MPALTTTREVRIMDGRAGASSFYDETWNPENAFMPDTLFGWHAGPRGVIPKPFPVFIWYEFRDAVTPAEISFRPRQDCASGVGVSNARSRAAAATCATLTPTKFQFVGSNDQICDDFSAWTVLCEDFADEAFASMRETRFCAADPARIADTQFRCLGLKIFGTKNVDGWTSLNNIRIWERVIAG